MCLPTPAPPGWWNVLIITLRQWMMWRHVLPHHKIAAEQAVVGRKVDQRPLPLPREEEEHSGEELAHHLPPRVVEEPAQPHPPRAGEEAAHHNVFDGQEVSGCLVVVQVFFSSFTSQGVFFPSQLLLPIFPIFFLLQATPVHAFSLTQPVTTPPIPPSLPTPMIGTSITVQCSRCQAVGGVSSVEKN